MPHHHKPNFITLCNIPDCIATCHCERGLDVDDIETVDQLDTLCEKHMYYWIKESLYEHPPTSCQFCRCCGN